LYTAVAALAAVASGTAGFAQMRPHIVPEGPLTPREELAKFHVPEGFEIELVASEPDIYNPLSISFDRRGRMWVSDTIEYPFPPSGPGRDGLKVFEDTDGDGRYDSVSTYVDGLSMPTGAEPIPGGAIVFSVPSIFGCYDTDGDGRIDRRSVLYTEFGSADAHGMNNGFTRWLDGWIYACHGYTNSSTVKGSDGQSITMVSGNGYRFRADGSHIEHTWFGQVNPYGIAFDPLGNLFTADCHSKPAYCLLRGAYYPSFGKPHDGLGFGPKLIDHSHGSTSISGIAYYAADQFPETYRDCVFMGNSVTGRVNCDKVTAHGSSLTGTELPDFVTCDDRWFRPVEIKLGPDGALYIADFYDCIIGYYEVPLDHPRRDRTRGRIWRVVYRGNQSKPRALRKIPDLATHSLEQLWGRLADPNLAVRLPATHEIVDRFGARAVQPVRRWMLAPGDPFQRAHGLWILHRLHALDGDLTARLSEDSSPLVRVHLVKSLAERTDWDRGNPSIRELVQRKLFDSDGFVRRAAADALGRHPHPENVALLLRQWRETDREDNYLIHTIRMALRDHLAREEIFREHAHLTGSADRRRRLLDVLLGLPGARAAGLVLRALEAGQYDPARLAEFIRFATRHASAGDFQEVSEYVLRWKGADPRLQMLVFRPYGLGLVERGGRFSPPMVAWAGELAGRLLASTDPADRLEGIQLAGSMRLRPLYERIARMAANPGEEIQDRILALQACVGIDGPRSVGLIDGILGNLGESFILRRAGASALSGVGGDESRRALYAHLLTAPHRMAAVLAASLAGSQAGAEMLLEAISGGKASPLLLRELQVLRALKITRVPDLENRIAGLTEDLPPSDEMTARKISRRHRAYLRSKPDVELGRAVFKKNCETCHQLSGQGNKFGPDLDGIGVRGLDRLLEDLLEPSRNVDPAFQTTTVITEGGLVQSGLALRDEGVVLLLVDSEGKELRIPHDEIAERGTSPLSPMPTDLETTLTGEEFNHLIGFLLEAKEPLKPPPDQPMAGGE